MRRVLFLAGVLLSTMVTPGTAAGPDLSATTLARLDDRLWAAGAGWRPVFDALHPAEQEALLRLNAVVQVVRTPTVAAMPPACQVIDCDPIMDVAIPPTERPIEHDIVVEAPPPYVCGSAQAEVVGYTIKGKEVTRAVDWMAYCIDPNGKFASYDHGHDANTYGWGWQVGSCICIERATPPVPGDEQVHEFHSEQTFNRQVGFGDFGFTDSSVANIEGYAKANGPYDGNHYIFGW